MGRKSYKPDKKESAPETTILQSLSAEELAESRLKFSKLWEWFDKGNPADPHFRVLLRRIL
jgi:hypothetical protein